MIIETRQQLIDNLAYANLAKKARLKEGDLKGAQAAQDWFDKLRAVFAEHEHSEPIPLRSMLSDKEVIAIRRKMIAEGRRGPITDADAEACINERPAP